MLKLAIFSAIFLFLGFLAANQFTTSQPTSENTVSTSPPKPTVTPKTYSKPSTNLVLGKIYGVNISGAEFGPENLPGVMGNDYIYPHTASDYQYFADKNIKIIRLPIRWERIQREAFGPLNAPDIQQIKKALEAANQNNMKVILDLHNFGRYFGQALTASDADKLADVWTKLALTFKDNPGLYGYELMNEPHDLAGGSQTWASISQHTVNQIRKVDNETLIIVPGYSWQSARNWTQNNPHFPIHDPQSNIIYSAHIYFDGDTSGKYAKSFNDDHGRVNIGITRSANFREWLKTHNVHGIFTEYGIPGNDQNWLTAMDLFLESTHNDPNITGSIYWSAGPWWKNYALSIEPQNGIDRPQMQILQKSTNLNP